MSQPPQGGAPEQGQGQGPQGAQGPGPYGSQGPSQPQPPYGQSPQPYGYPGGYGQPGQPGHPPQGPAQGAPQGSYGFVPGAQGPQPYQPGAAGPGQPGPQPGQPAKKRTGLFVLIGAGALVLVLIIAVVAVRAGRGGGTSATEPGGSASAPVATKPSDAVQGFLEAVAANDSAKALGYLYEQPADTTFLTDQALQASSKLAPMTNISVPETASMATDGITASFALGGKTYTHKFTPFRDGDAWKLYDGVSEVGLSGARNTSLPMIVNGTKVTGDSLFLAPGTYVFTTGSRWVSYGSNRLVVGSDQYARLPDGLVPTLTKDGTSTVLAKTKAAFSACLAQHKLKPKGCPNHLDDLSGAKVDESTVRWRVTKDPFRNAKITLDYEDPTVAEGEFSTDYRIKAKISKGGRTGTVETDVIGDYSFKTVADLSKTDVTVKLVG